MENKSVENIYVKTISSKNISLHPKYFGKSMNEHILKILKNNIEGKCNKNGFVKKDSVKFIKKSLGYVRPGDFSGSVNYNVTFSADICCPANGNIIKCKVINSNKMGILAENGPISAIIAKQFHNNREVFKNIKIEQEIDILVIDKKYDVNDTKISVIGKIIQSGHDKNINTVLLPSQ